ncbi:hypothetical protein N9W79_01690 [bacterium]|nr:hypothetical protein [bacterium]
MLVEPIEALGEKYSAEGTISTQVASQVLDIAQEVFDLTSIIGYGMTPKKDAVRLSRSIESRYTKRNDQFLETAFELYSAILLRPAAFDDDSLNYRKKLVIEQIEALTSDRLLVLENSRTGPSTQKSELAIKEKNFLLVNIAKFLPIWRSVKDLTPATDENTLTISK